MNGQQQILFSRIKTFIIEFVTENNKYINKGILKYNLSKKVYLKYLISLKSDDFYIRKISIQRFKNFICACKVQI